MSVGMSDSVRLCVPDINVEIWISQCVLADRISACGDSLLSRPSRVLSPARKEKRRLEMERWVSMDFRSLMSYYVYGYP